jgi:type I restriction enzyme S subunit
MEVKPGYKQTQAGIIPGDWELKQIGELKPFVTSGSRGWARFYSERGSPFIRITNLSRDHISLDLRKLRFVDIDQNEPEAGRTQLQDGDILISITADIGMIGHVSASLSKPAYINQHIALVRFDPSRVDSKFVGYFLTTERPQRLFRFLTDAGAKAGMNLTTVQQIHVAVPPTVAEQHAIAEALSDADALIESLEQLIAKKRHLNQGAMQELLTGRTRLSGFEVKSGYKHTEVGAIPEDWAVTKLGKHATFKTGPFGSALHQSDYVDGGVPVINPMQIVDGRIQPTASMAITEQAARKLSDFRLSKGDVVIGRRGDMGRCALVQPKQHGWLCGTGSMIIRSGASLDGRFIQRVLSSPPVIAAIENASVGSTMINLNQGTLGNLLVPLPPTKAEQEAIAAILSDMDAEVAGLEAKLAKDRQLKQGMMQELLTGKIRLI